MKTVLLSKFRVSLIILAIIVFVVSVCSFNLMPTGSANTAKEYTKFNAETGAQIGTYSLTVQYGEQPAPRNIIGSDDRYIDWTKNGVVKIFSDGHYRGTGFVVGRHEIATAAHVLVSVLDNGVVRGTSISEIKLFKADGSVDKTITCPTNSDDPKIANRKMEYHIPTPFFSNGKNSNYDFAVIKVPEDLKEYQCFDVGYPTNSFVNSTSSIVTVTGFPEYVGGSVVNDDKNNNMYTGVGHIVLNNYDPDIFIRYTNDTYGGNSGSPIYVTETVRGETFYTVIGIHTKGSATFNKGIRFDSDILKFLKGNPQVQEWG